MVLLSPTSVFLTKPVQSYSSHQQSQPHQISPTSFPSSSLSWLSLSLMALSLSWLSLSSFLFSGIVIGHQDFSPTKQTDHSTCHVLCNKFSEIWKIWIPSEITCYILLQGNKSLLRIEVWQKVFSKKLHVNQWKLKMPNFVNHFS